MRKHDKMGISKQREEASGKINSSVAFALFHILVSRIVLKMDSYCLSHPVGDTCIWKALISLTFENGLHTVTKTVLSVLSHYFVSLV